MRLVNPIIQHDLRSPSLPRKKYALACLLESLTFGRMNARYAFYDLDLTTLFNEITLTLARQGAAIE